ncbi:hypothetical protein Acsp06_23490 [Actinomycetospora sp. NBRC 106375]|uniref:hypothetical protein n=1 Tax=Actinomycetospora sp. NBRC 106375 TaxID=3032207 RepID=UPI0024A48C26|nr:hypothetical protein [Actinomycetospora sp. NBRC 106375]GLZ46164.1 hypothetical protein Acsp06_23490 [Actinomycetospora sp. NBRC 106375]
MSVVPAHSPIAQLMRPGARPRVADIPVDDREHAVTVVAHLLHAECEQWSWTTHTADHHRADALRIVGALTREGWAPRSAA